MFQRKEFSDFEIEQLKISLNAAMRQASESRARIIKDRVRKLKSHSDRVNQVRRRGEKKAKVLPDISQLNLSGNMVGFVDELQRIDSVEGFQSTMQKQDTIKQAEKVVEFLEGLVDPDSLLCDGVKCRPKIFLSLMLLARFPDEMMPDATAEERKVLVAAAELVDAIQKSDDKNNKAIAWTWINAVNLFAEWSVRDRSALRNRMRQDFLRWQKKIGNWQREHHCHAEWEPHALEYQNQIINKIYQVFGHAEVDSLKKEIDQLNKTFTEADLVVEFDSTVSEYKCSWVDREKKDNEESKENVALLAETRKRISNIQILHELMLKEDSVNFDRVLNLAGAGSLTEVTKKNIKTMSALTVMLKAVDDPKRVANVLTDIYEYMRASLIELAGDNPDYRKEIQLIDCSINACDWVKESEQLLESILFYCKKCCAPIRDLQCIKIEKCISELKSNTSVETISSILMDTLSEILELLNNMRSDFSNFRLKMLAANLEGKGVAEKYELDHLKELTGDAYPKTSQWLLKQASGEDAPLETLVKAFLRLFDPQVAEVIEEHLPETLHLDIERVTRYRSQLIKELTLDSVMVFLKGHLKTNAAEFESLEAQIKGVVSIEDIKTILQNHLKEGTEGDVLKATITRLIERPQSDKVFTLLKHRAFAKIRSLMVSTKEIEQKNTIEGKIAALFRYNRACFSQVYDKILMK